MEEEGKKGGQRKRKCEYKSGHQGIRLLKRPLILFQHSTKMVLSVVYATDPLAPTVLIT